MKINATAISRWRNLCNWTMVELFVPFDQGRSTSASYQRCLPSRLQPDGSVERLDLVIIQGKSGFGARLCGIISLPLLAVCLSVGTAQGKDPIALTISATNFDVAVQLPNNFSGLSYGMGQGCIPGVSGVSGQPFDPTNAQLITLFQNTGIHELRIGWGIGEQTLTNTLTAANVDKAFAFAKATGVKVVWGLQQMNATTNFDIGWASYVFTNYQSSLDYFAIGNEPDEPAGLYPPFGTGTDPAITNYSSFLASYNQLAGAVASAVSGAPFAGPDTGGLPWNSNFADAELGSGFVDLFTTHDYFGGSATGKTADIEVSNMMSQAWISIVYPNELNGMSKVIGDGYPYRLQEINDILTGVTGASDAFASALWSLDVMHWWSVAQKCVGVNFHNTEFIPTDTFGHSSAGWYVNPKACGIKAFDLGGHGYEVPLSISNPNNANTTCYAVGGGQDLYVTIINKHSTVSGSISAVTNILNGYAAASVAGMYLTAPNSNLETNNVTLGGGVITNNAQWQGLWTSLTPATNGQCEVDVSPSSAVIIHFRAGCAYVGPIQINNNGALEIFAVGTNGDVWHNWQMTANIFGSAPTNWVGWIDIGSVGGGVAATGTPTVVKNLDGTLEVFVSGSDGNVYYSSQSKPGGDWVGWNNLKGTGITNLQVAINADGSLNLFGIGSHGDVWNTSQVAPGFWSGTWNELSGVQVRPGFVVGQNLSGQLEIFGVDGTGAIWYKCQNTNWASWGSWTSLGGTVNPYLQVARALDGRLYVYGIGNGSTLNYIWQMTPGGSWTNWNTTDLSGQGIQPIFVVGQNGNGRFEIVAVGTNGTVYHNAINASGVWGDWSSLGGQGTPPQLMIGNLLNGSLQAFGINTNNAISSIWQTAPGGSWSSWTDFGKPVYGMTPVTNIVYQDSFSRTGALNGSTPSPVDTSNATWIAFNQLFTDGSEIAVTNANPSGGNHNNAFLPLTPKAGHIYTLSADIKGTSGGVWWLAVGFARHALLSTDFYNTNIAVGWILQRADNSQVQAFLGPGAQNLLANITENGDTSVFNTYKVVLDTTTGNAANGWTITFFQNGTQFEQSVYSSNPSIAYASVSADGSTGYYRNFSLTDYAPEYRPVINSVSSGGGNLIFSGTNGFQGNTYCLSSSTNLASGHWTIEATNTFDANGAFSITNPVTPGTPQKFYRLQLQ
jgi:hypothetical protein